MEQSLHVNKVIFSPKTVKGASPPRARRAQFSIRSSIGHGIGMSADSSTALSTARYLSPPPHTISNLEVQRATLQSRRCSHAHGGSPACPRRHGGSKSRPAQSACTLPVILCGSITYLTASP
jgi:hypothetical protein